MIWRAIIRWMDRRDAQNLRAAAAAQLTLALGSGDHERAAVLRQVIDAAERRL